MMSTTWFSFHFCCFKFAQFVECVVLYLSWSWKVSSNISLHLSFLPHPKYLHSKIFFSLKGGSTDIYREAFPQLAHSPNEDGDCTLCFLTLQLTQVPMLLAYRTCIGSIAALNWKLVLPEAHLICFPDLGDLPSVLPVGKYLKVRSLFLNFAKFNSFNYKIGELDCYQVL